MASLEDTKPKGKIQPDHAEGSPLDANRTPDRTDYNRAAQAGRDQQRQTFSADVVGGLVTDGVNNRNFNSASRELGAGVQAAYDKGGPSAALDYNTDVDKNVKLKGVGTVLTTKPDGGMQAHIVEAGPQGMSAEDARNAGYFRNGDQYVRDLAKPVDIDTQKFGNDRRTQDARGAVDGLMANPGFAANGKMDQQTANDLERSMFRHDGDMAQFTKAINQELASRGSPYELSVDVNLNQRGMHGNTVTQYHVQTFNKNTNERVQGFTGGHDTVRSIGRGPELKFD